MVNKQVWKDLTESLEEKNIALVAVSKTKPAEDILEMYELGQRDFGENYVQEMIAKQPQLPDDIRWHFIGHLQSNKVRQIAPFVHLIHAVDRFGLLKEINKEAKKNNRVIDVLLQMHIAEEASKFGMDTAGVFEFMSFYEAQEAELQNIRIRGLMGMASFTEDEDQIRKEFKTLYSRFDNMKRTDFLFRESFNICSMGMSGDYKMAIEEGSNMIRIGSLLFGERPKMEK